MDIGVLVKEAKQGNKDSLVKLIMSQKSEYYKLAYVYMKNKEDALDAMEDMIVILYENIHRLKKEDAFYSWSKSILVNCCKKNLKKNNKIISIDTIQEEVCEDGFSGSEDKMVLQKHLAKLSEKHQEVIKLKYFLDLDNQSIADIIKIPIGTVKSRIFTGLKKLKESLGGEV